MKVELRKIRKKDSELFKRLYQLYIYDLSEFTGDDLDDKGLFLDDSSQLYLEEKDLIPLFIDFQGQPIGFILLQTGEYSPLPKVDYYIGEFFVLKKYRGRGLAKKAVKKLFQDYRGKYLLGQLSNNKPAISFWTSCYEDFNINYREYVEDMGEEDYFYSLQLFQI